MKTKLFVKSFNEERLISCCEVIESDILRKGEFISVDLTVNADFGEMQEQELVGKHVFVNSFQSCEYIGVGVSLAD